MHVMKLLTEIPSTQHVEELPPETRAHKFACAATTGGKWI